MVLWWLFAICLLLFALQYRESFTDPDRSIPPPVLTATGEIPAIWQTKIDANAPIDSEDIDYFNALKAFHDRVYVPSQTKPKDTQVEAFLQTADAKFSGVDIDALRKMIGSSFSIEYTTTAAAREQQKIVTSGPLAGFTGSNLQPGDAVDQVYTRDEGAYIPADSRKGDLPEGLYAPTEQTTPLGRGESKTASTSWSSVLPYSVCPCAENVL